jgi:hypothetical protein
MEMQRRFLHCSSAKELQSLIQESTDRLPVGAYQIDRVATAAKERIEMRSTAPVLAPEATKLELTQEQQRIYFFIQKTKTDIQQIKTIATRLQLPKSGAEMNADQAFVLIGEMLIEWAIGGQWLDRSIVTVLLSKSIERTKTDLELWEDFSLSVESYQRNGVRASPF